MSQDILGMKVVPSQKSETCSFEGLDISVGAETLAANGPHYLWLTDVEKSQSFLSFRYRNDIFLIALT